MKITGLSAQIKNPNRLNIMIDGTYKFSLDISQIVDLGVKVGREFTEQELLELQEEGEFSKLYSRALEYTFMRPHSSREVKDYLWRKTRATHSVKCVFRYRSHMRAFISQLAHSFSKARVSLCSFYDLASGNWKKRNGGAGKNKSRPWP